jgi:peptidoglycan glycosyltransferase
MKDLQLGDDVALTLALPVQMLAYELLGDRKGVVVVVDVRTGEIIAAASTPSFDPNTKERVLWQQAFSDSDKRPYENRAFRALYPPGSTFKTVIASAWIEQEGKFAGSSRKELRVHCNGRKNRYGISDIHTHGIVDLDTGFAESCNLFFSEAGVTLGPLLLDYARMFGFNRRWDLIPQIKDHGFASLESTAFMWNGNAGGGKGKEFSDTDFRRNPKLIAQGSIGQNLVSATPLQMAMVAATVANRGVMRTPYIVKEIRTGDGKVVEFSATTIAGQRVIAEKTALRLKDMMEKVMTMGTGKNVKKVFLEGNRFTIAPQTANGSIVRVAGKTGTAEVGDRNNNGQKEPNERPHSWFIGFAPADNPRYAIAVIAENQGFGSLAAAPIAVEVLAEAMNTGSR